MNFLELTQKRCSIRRYLSAPIEEEKINYILESARMAPSAVNYQPWYLLLVTEEEGRDAIGKCYPREWISSAPVFIVVCSDHEQSWKRGSDNKDHSDIDTGILIEHICLAATEQGLATCIVCNFDVISLKKYLGIPDAVEPVAIIPIAYPEDQELFAQTPKKRKAIEEIVRKERFD